MKVNYRVNQAYTSLYFSDFAKALMYLLTFNKHTDTIKIYIG
ncbi:hypothetical protein BH23BAC3_BH23BAC3_30660 [soil metagenome]